MRETIRRSVICAGLAVGSLALGASAGFSDPGDTASRVDTAARDDEGRGSRPLRFGPGRLIVKFREPLASDAGGRDADALLAAASAGTDEPRARSIRRLFAASRPVADPALERRLTIRARRADQGVGTPHLEETFALDFPDERDARRALAAYLRDPRVEYVQRDLERRAAHVPDDPFYGSAGSWGQAFDDMWGLKRLELEGVWDTIRGAGVVVAVVDTGLDYTHPDIAANVWTNTAETAGNGLDDDGNGFVDDVRGWDFAYGDNDPRDGDGHGTHVSGIIAAVGDNGIGMLGVAPEARILPVKALTDTGSGYSSRLAQAIVYATDNGADVINNSWGCSSRCPEDPVVEDAVRYAVAHGVVVVFAAGNSSDDVAYYSPENMRDSRPVVVGSTGRDDQLSSFSNYGALVDVVAPGGGPADDASLFEPARNILSLKSETCSTAMCPPELTVGSHFLRQAGTSMAAPYVSGVLALMVAADPAASVSTLKLRLFGNAIDLGPAGEDTSFGSGLVSAGQAIADATPFVIGELTSPRADERRGGQIEILGTAAARELVSYEVLVGSGPNPSSWTANGVSLTGGQVVDGTLATWDSRGVTDGVWTVRLLVHGAATTVESRVTLSIDTLLRRGWPQSTAAGLSPSYWSTLVVADLDLDGFKEIVSGSFYGLLFAWRHDGQLMPGFPVDAYGYDGETLTPAVGNIDSDPELEIVVGANTTHPNGLYADLYAFNHDASPVSGWPKISANYISDPPTLADIDGDGDLEILVGEEDWKIHAYHGDGQPVAGWPVGVDHGQNVSGVTVGDIDGDGDVEVLAGNDGYVYAWHHRDIDGDGKADRVAGWPVAVPAPSSGYNETVFVAPSLADVDGDGRLEVAATGGAQYSNHTNYQVLLWRGDGQPMPGWPRYVPATVQWCSVAFGDLDADGLPDLVASGADNTVWAWRWDGSVIPGFPGGPGGSTDVSRGHSPALGDLDGDGRLEIVAGVGSGVTVLEHDGTTKAGWPRNVDVDTAPAIADLDGNGTLEVVALAEDGRVYVWDVAGGNGERKLSWPMLGQNAAHPGRRLNAAPVAVAGPDHVVGEGEPVLLDGSSSVDPDGDPITFQWKDDSGSVIATEAVTTTLLARGAHLVRLRVLDDREAAGVDATLVTVGDAGPPVVALTSPAGESYLVGAPVVARWDAADDILLTGFDLLVSADPAGPFVPLAACTALPGDARSCAFTAPGPAAPNGRIRVVARDSAGHASQHETAFVTVEPVFQLVAPVGAVSWEVGTVQTIAWHHNLAADALVDVEVSYDNGVRWRSLASAAAGAGGEGSLAWLVEGPGTASALVRIRWAGPPALADTSQVPFSIRTLAEPAYRVRDIHATAGSAPAGFRALGRTVLFSATSLASGTELWRSDGSEAGTQLVADINAGTASSAPASIVTLPNGMALFSAEGAGLGRELWRSDGTAAGTFLVKDIAPGPAASNPTELTVVGNRIVFAATDAAGTELWQSDGTLEGTLRIKDIVAGASSSWPTTFSPLPDGTVLFAAYQAETARELWKTDWTASGTVLVKDLYPGTGYGSPTPLGLLGNRLLFSAGHPTSGRELWSSDGTEAGTVLVRDIAAGSDWSSPAGGVVSNGILFFQATTSATGAELWRSDGTEAGTALVKDILPGTTASYPGNFTAVAGVVFFATSHNGVREELWKTDGTEAGTTPIRDINPSGLAYPSSLTAAGGLLYFSATNGTEGAELWRSDGTTAGTIFLQDINPGPASSSPGNLTVAGPYLFFSATDSTGAELWALRWRTPRELDVKLTAPNGGSGRVDVAPPGDSCVLPDGSPENTCLHSYARGTVVTLTAVASAGSGFAGWSGACGGQGACALTMDDDESVTAVFAPTVSIDDVTVNEGQCGTTLATFTVSLSAASTSTVSVDYATADGTATIADGDYAPANGTLAFAPGETSKQIAVAVNGDATFEADEIFTVTLSAPVNAILAKQTGTATITDTPLQAGTQWVTWTQAVGAAVCGPSLTKTATTGWGNAGAVSTQTITSGDGYVELTASETTTKRMIGLSNGNTDSSYTDIDFALYLNLGTIQIYEAGAFKGGFGSYATGDTLRVAVGGGVVSYSRNGTVFSTSSRTPVYPLLVDTALYTQNATLSSVKLSTTTTAAPVASIADVSLAEGNADQTLANFTVTLSGPATEETRIDYATADGTASAGSDYTSTTGTLVIAQGATGGTISVPVLGDTAVEPDETFTVTLANAVGATIGNGSATGTITNDDAPPSGVQAVIWTAEVGVTVSANSLTKTAATNWGNAGAVSTQTITSGDGYVELTASETTTKRMIGLSNGNTNSSYADIDFALYLNLGTIQIYEAGAFKGSFGSYATGDTLRVDVSGGVVSYSRNGTVFSTSSKTPVYPLLVDSALYTLGATLSSVVIAAAAPTAVSVSIADVSLAEGDADQAMANFPVTLSAPATEETRIDYATVNGTASAGSDYTSTTGTLVIAQGATGGTISVPVLGDTAVELDETFTVTLSNAVGATIGNGSATGTITNDDAPPSGVVPVVWTAAAGVTVNGNSLTKTASSNWGNAGAVSTQTIGSGDGYVELTASEMTTKRMLGLSNGDTNSSYTDIDFALYLCAGTIQIYEAGAFKGSFGSYATGDTLRVDVSGGVVSYSRNGTIFSTSSKTPVYPLLVDTALYTQGATLSSVLIATGP